MNSSGVGATPNIRIKSTHEVLMAMYEEIRKKRLNYFELEKQAIEEKQNASFKKLLKEKYINQSESAGNGAETAETPHTAFHRSDAS